MRTVSAQVGNLTDWRVTMHEPLAALQSAAPDLLLTGGGEWSTTIEMPRHLLDAAADAVKRRPQYTDEFGIMPLREAIAQKLRDENGIDASARDEVMVTSSATEAINVTMRTLLEQGDEVVAGDPYYLSIYEPNIRLAGASIRSVPTGASDSFRLDPDRVEEAVGPQTKVLLITSPENPTGSVVTPAAARRLAEIAVAHDLWVVSDELYEKFVYDGLQHTSIAALPGMRERTITINGFSKTYGLTGYRVGYIAAPAPLMRQLRKVHYATTLCASEVSQRVALAALAGPQDWLQPIIAAYGKSRREMADQMNQIPGIECPLPQGAIYLFPDISAFGYDSMEMCQYVIREARVANRPGHYFGAAGEGRIRFNIPPDPVTGQKVIGRLADALSGLTVATPRS